MNDPVGTPIYSPFAAEMTFDEIQAQLVSDGEQYWSRAKRPPSADRENYVQLPWYLEDLVGTTWCNIHTGSMLSVEEVVDVDFPYGRERVARCGISYADIHRKLGFWWWKGRYIIEHDVKVDLAPPAEMFKWLLHSVTHSNRSICREQKAILEMDRDPLRVSCYGENRRWKLRCIEQERKELLEATARVRQFAEAHGIAVTMEHLNSGADVVGAPAQLRFL